MFLEKVSWMKKWYVQILQIPLNMGLVMMAKVIINFIDNRK